jgi:hypothetical protein
MRVRGLLSFGVATALGGGFATGCATRHEAAGPPVTVAQARGVEVSGVWNAINQTTLSEGFGAGDTRIAKEEWHLTQNGQAIRGYYIAALTFVSGDGRPYICSRQPQFSALQRFDVSGRVREGVIELDELGQEVASVGSHCDLGPRQLAHYRGRLDGEVLTLVSGRAEKRTLYRIHDPDAAQSLLSQATGDRGEARSSSDDDAEDDWPLPSRPSPSPAPSRAPGAPSTGPMSSDTADVSGMWVWEHHGMVPGGDEKQEREEWHVTQNGTKLSGYYDRVVHQVSVDGHAYRCSMALDFQIATRYQFSGEVRGNDVRIYESSFEVLSPNACDNGKRRLDVYEGEASNDEIRLVWGVGGQVLRRPRPDVPTQRF